MELSDDSLALGISDWNFIYFYLGGYEQVINSLNHLSPKDQRLTENQRQLGQAYAAMGDYEKALPLLETVWVDTGQTSGNTSYSGFDVFDVAALVAALPDRTPIIILGELNVLPNTPGYQMVINRKKKAR